MNTQLVKTLSEIIKSLSEDEQQQLQRELKLAIDSQIRDNHQENSNATPQEKAKAFREWAESHRGKNFPSLSDEDISRESIYGERG